MNNFKLYCNIILNIIAMNTSILKYLSYQLAGWFKNYFEVENPLLCEIYTIKWNIWNNIYYFININLLLVLFVLKNWLLFILLWYKYFSIYDKTED